MAKYAQGKFALKNPEKYVGKRVPMYRSSWEMTVFSFCDNNPSIIQWASESINIPYRNPVTGKQTIYVPDILWVYVDANQNTHAELVEIKPMKETMITEKSNMRDKLAVAVNMAKWAAAQAFCNAQGLKFRVLTEFDIFSNMKR